MAVQEKTATFANKLNKYRLFDTMKTNTDTTGDPNDMMNGGEPMEGMPLDEEGVEQPLMPDQNALDQMLIGHELAQAYDASGNSAERSET